ncbi:hypothetical protein AAG570_001982 [Ranatra chinensis]|uniref:Ribosomal protein S3 n=1 Tax=Ranatra chinensis TaxID=642074 RepID=A0ABD0YLY5_9HEMI
MLTPGVCLHHIDRGGSKIRGVHSGGITRVAPQQRGTCEKESYLQPPVVSRAQITCLLLQEKVVDMEPSTSPPATSIIFGPLQKRGVFFKSVITGDETGDALKLREQKAIHAVETHQLPEWWSASTRRQFRSSFRGIPAPWSSRQDVSSNILRRYNAIFRGYRSQYNSNASERFAGGPWVKPFSLFTSCRLGILTDITPGQQLVRGCVRMSTLLGRSRHNTGSILTTKRTVLVPSSMTPMRGLSGLSFGDMATSGRRLSVSHCNRGTRSWMLNKLLIAFGIPDCLRVENGERGRESPLDRFPTRSTHPDNTSEDVLSLSNEHDGSARVIGIIQKTVYYPVTYLASTSHTKNAQKISSVLVIGRQGWFTKSDKSVRKSGGTMEP